MKKMILPLLACFFPIMLIMLLVGGGGGNSLPTPVDEDGSYAYQYAGHKLGVNWELALLIHTFTANKEGKNTLDDYNCLYTTLNFTKLKEDVYTSHVETDEEGNYISTTYEYSHTNYYSGAGEILGYLEINETETDVDVVVKKIETKSNDNSRLSLESVSDYKLVLDTYTDLSEVDKENILRLEEEHYYAQIYGNIFGEVTGGDIHLGDIITGENGLPIPLYLQYSGGWENIKFGGGNIASSGCSLTSMAMVFSYLKDETITPDMIVAWTGNKYYVAPAGQSWAIFPDCANNWGVRCTNLGKSSQAIVDALSSGKPVIASMSPGTFTKGGHFIVLRGITDEGKILVNDPNDNTSKNFINKEFDINLILRESKNFWSFSN